MATLLLVTVLPACTPPQGIPLPTGPSATTQTVIFRMPVPDFVSDCGDVTIARYFFVDANLLVTGLTRVVNGSRVGMRTNGITLSGRFHAPLGCPATIASTDGGPASVAFSGLYAAELGLGGTCVQRSRLDYRQFVTRGFGLAAVFVDPIMRDRFWRQFDQFAVVPSLYAPPTPLPPGRCSSWSELPLP